jgi:hypothetical protein
VIPVAKSKQGGKAPVAIRAAGACGSRYGFDHYADRVEPASKGDGDVRARPRGGRRVALNWPFARVTLLAGVTASTGAACHAAGSSRLR